MPKLTRPISPGPLVRPLPTATAIAVAYILFGCCYIVATDLLAAEAVPDMPAFLELQMVKGLAYMGISGIGLFGLCLAYLNRVRRAEQVQIQLRHAVMVSERRAVAATLASTLGHDLNNTLTSIYGGLDTVGRRLSGDEDGRAEVDRLWGSANHLRNLARRLLQIHQEGSVEDEMVMDLRDLVQGAVDFARYHKSVRHCHVHVELPHEPAPFRGAPGSLTQVLLNLLINAGESNPGQCRVLVRLVRQEGFALIEVHDNGPGVAAGDQDRIFAPFETTKPGGSGLGLVSVRTTAESYGGDVTVEPGELGGACFRVRVPLEPTPLAS